MAEDQVITSDNPVESRYEAHLDGALAAYTEYELEDTLIIFIHTESLPEFAGRGMASRLATHALNDARQRGLDVIPECPYIRRFMGKHPEYQNLIPHDRRSEFVF